MSKIKGIAPAPCQEAQSGLEHILARIKAESWEELYHLGWLGNSRQDHPSHEGLLLSTSEYPNEWCRIAKLGGRPEWAISRNDNRELRLLSMHNPTTKKAIAAWGLAKGILLKEKWWWTPTSTDEEGDIFYCWSQTPEKEYDPEIEEKPKARMIEVPSPELWAFWNQRMTRHGQITPWRAIDAAAAALVEITIRVFGESHELALDGLFWDELLDPSQLSAPRMGLIPHKMLTAEATVTA